MPRRIFHVYIMASHRRVLYSGVTSKLGERVLKHKRGEGSEFTRKYNITRLVYAEEAPDASTAIEREKQIKRWRREKRLRLIETINADWKDLAVEYGIVGDE